MGQVPAKLLDAMAMSKPIVSTRVSEIPQLLEGCGLLVTPGDVDGIADAMGRILADRELAEGLGQAARERFIANYSYDAMRRILADVLASLV